MGIDVEIGKSKNIKREIYKGTLFYDKLEIILKEKNEIIYRTNILPGRYSYEQNEKIIMQKIETIKKRLKINDINLKLQDINFFEKFIYKFFLFFKVRISRYLFPTQWIIGYKNINENTWKYLDISSEKMQADPFIVFENEKYFIFYEELYFEENKGYISVGELDLEKNRLINQRIVLEKECHLSYPFIFKENNTWYMIPESSQNKTVDLYEAESFPYKWKVKKTLLKNIETVDSTLIKKDNIWYLFTNEKQLGISPNDELSIYYSENFLNKEFKKLFLNPIISDVSCARMGGKFFLKNNKIYRVSQDCSKRYGYRVNVNEILELNQNNYRERKIKIIDHPKNKKVIGMHTYNSSNEIEVVDFLILKNDIISLIKNIKNNLKSKINKRN